MCKIFSELTTSYDLDLETPAIHCSTCCLSEMGMFAKCLYKQDKFDEFISPDEGLFERNM